MAHMVLYCDESGKYPNSPVVSYCGFVASAETWNKFQQQWTDLRGKWKVPPIHMGHIYHPDEHPEWGAVKQRWGADWEVDRERMLLQFADIVFNSHVSCIGAVLDCLAFDRMPHLKQHLVDPQYLTFEKAVLSVVKRVEWGNSDALLGLIVDDDPEKAIDFYKLLGLLRKNIQDVGKRISAICFANDEHYAGIQAADMIAYTSRDLLRQELPPSDIFLKLIGDLNDSPFLLDEPALATLDEATRRIIEQKEAESL